MSDAAFAWLRENWRRARLQAAAQGVVVLEYGVAPVRLAGGPVLQQAKSPSWQEAGGLTVSRRALGSAGLQMPVLQPEQALLLHLTTS
jgi:hypothetical protein